MKKKKVGFFEIALLSFATILTSCRGGTSIGNSSSIVGFNSELSSSVEDVVEKDDIMLKVQATKTKINFVFTNKTTKINSTNLRIVGVKAYQYLEGDNTRGLSNDIVDYNDAKVFGTYQLGKSETVSFDRYYLDSNFDYDIDEEEYVEKEIEYDGIYNKYYILDGNSIFLGPLYVTDIESEVSENPTFNIKSKKGILGENTSIYNDLNCSYVTINFTVEELMYPNEYFYTGDGVYDAPIHIDAPNDSIEFESNGKIYYFNKSIVSKYDTIIKSYYDMGAHITAIVYANNKNINDRNFPIKMTYAPYSLDGSILVALNTSNQYGFEYYVAMMEFIASRYSEDDFAKGYIANYVVSNEIDYAKDYHRISEKHVSLDTYMEEYSRLLRLTNLVVKKYHKNTTVAVPFTHAWASAGYSNNDAIQPYIPKEMIEWLNSKTKQEGDYDWGIAPHCYGYHLAQPAVYQIDTAHYQFNVVDKGGRAVGMNNDYNTTSIISFSNLEILDLYLNQDEMKCNGKVRSVWLTESGVSSCKDSIEERNIQAAMVAAIWYKVSQLDCIKSFSYFRMMDHEVEIKDYALFGLVDKDGEKKPSYNVYKYIDTQYSKYVSNEYLKYIKYYDENGAEVTVKDYLETLNVFNTSYDFSNYSWEKATPQIVDTIYEWEDKEDLTNVSFESKTFIYDGTEKEITVKNIPSGVVVEYDDGDDSNNSINDNKLTEVGTKSVIATLRRNGQVIGQRKATITINSLFSTNKTVYKYGESIFVTALSKQSQGDKDWIGIFKKGANLGNTTSADDVSIYYYYPNNKDNCLRTSKLQTADNYNGIVNDGNVVNIAPGEYTIHYLLNDGYESVESIDITVLGNNQESSTVDLSGVSFEDTIKEVNDSVSLTINGNLPEGVTVNYVNNTLTEEGSINACAIFFKDGIEIERRYAVLTTKPVKKLSLNQSEYYLGDDVIVSAYGENDAQWVGLYLESDDVTATVSIYWYYTKDYKGISTNIKDTILNNTRSEYKNLPAGNYKMILFADGGYTIAEEVKFTILNQYRNDITFNKSSYFIDEEILVTCQTQSNDEWVGVFKADCVDYNSDNLICSYSSSTEGQSINQLTVDLSSKHKLTDGKYKVVIFSSSEFTSNRYEKTFSIINRVRTDKDVYGVGEDILVTSNISTEFDWVGIFKADCGEYGDNTLLGYYSPATEKQNINGLTVNLLTKCGGNLSSGEYIIVLFNTGDYSQPYAYKTITIR